MLDSNHATTQDFPKQDECLRIVARRPQLDLRPLITAITKYAGLGKETSADRIEAAVADEIRDLLERALAALSTVTSGATYRVAAIEQLQASQRGPAPFFPSEALRDLEARARDDGHDTIADAIGAWVARHAALIARVGWLVGGTSAHAVQDLDPLADADRIYHSMISNFRVECRIAELLAIMRIAQSDSVALFFRSTREAENNAVVRL